MTLHKGTISRRGGWRESFQVYSRSGATDPTLYVFKVQLWPADSGCGGCDGDEVWGGSRLSSLEAATDDGTARMVGEANDNGMVLTWAFPADVVSRLNPGAYNGSVTAALASAPTEPTEVLFFTRVAK